MVLPYVRAERGPGSGSEIGLRLILSMVWRWACSSREVPFLRKEEVEGEFRGWRKVVVEEGEVVPAVGPGGRAFLAASARPRPCGWMA